MARVSFTVTGTQSGERLDVFLTRNCPELTRSRIKKLIEGGHVLLDGNPSKAGSILHPGSSITIEVPEPEPSRIRPEPIPLNVLYEDADLIVIDKPADMVVHPAQGHPSGTLVNALLHHCRDLSGIGGVTRPGIVHRLDKGTSGVMVAAKTDAAHRALSEQFRDHSIGRVYLAAVKGEMGAQRGRIEKPLARREKDRKKIGVRMDGKKALTDYEVLGRRGGISLVRLTPGTGRTHQLRVHLSSEGHPVLGDVFYSGGTSTINLGVPSATALARRLKRPALHAWLLEFNHPGTGKRMSFTSEPPEDISGLFDWITGEG